MIIVGLVLIQIDPHSFLSNIIGFPLNLLLVKLIQKLRRNTGNVFIVKIELIQLRSQYVSVIVSKLLEEHA